MFKPIKDRIEYGGAIMGNDEREAMLRVFDSQGGKRWTIGQESVLFEKELAEKVGVKHAVVVNSGSSALLVAIAALKLPKGSKVIIPALNFPTAFNAIIQNGLVPYVVDIDIDNLLLDMVEVKKAVANEKIDAVIAVNIASNPVDLEVLREIVGPDCKIVLDNCIAKGTLVKTNMGDKPIEEIRVGDMVLTRKGYKRVLRTMYKGVQPVIERFGVIATPDHKFITTKGKKALNVLKPSDILYSCKLPTTETPTTDILNQNTGIKESIGTALVKELDICTDTGGKINTVKSLRDALFTIKTETPSIMKHQTLRQLHQNNILRNILQKMEDWKLQIKTLIRQELELLNGISLMLERNFMPNTTSGFGLLGKNQPMFAQSVNKNIRPFSPQGQSFAQEDVGRKAEVYDLTVEDAHEFFANGILVSNCDGLGTLYRGKYVETYADISCVSFHAAHIITMGEGGAVLTDDKTLADRSRKLREWGRASGTDTLYKYPGFPPDYRERYVYEEIGWNLKPLELQCAIGRVQLKKLETFRNARIKNFELLYDGLSHIPQLTPVFWNYLATVCWFSFPFLCEDGKREHIMETLERNNIECRTIFSGNILKHPAYQNVEYLSHSEEMPMADKVMFNGVFISVHPSITEEMIKFILKVLEKAV
jgi:dTDP-4-amino-4,6-dideoxygalactose transaminase